MAARSSAVWSVCRRPQHRPPGIERTPACGYRWLQVPGWSSTAPNWRCAYFYSAYLSELEPHKIDMGGYVMLERLTAGHCLW